MDIEGVILPEIPKLAKKFKCEFCGKEFKSKNGHKNHVEKSCKIRKNIDEGSETPPTEYAESMIDYDPLTEARCTEHDKELKKLKKELENLILNNPSIDLNKPVSVTEIEKIENMSIEELKARIFNAKRELNGKLDLKISDSALGIVNQIVGRFLGCCEELEEAVMSDKLLRESTKEMMSMNILSKIPNQIKVAGLYSLNVGSALSKKRYRQNVESNVENMVM